ncbi:hypothetical protein [Mycobacteroides salmoniphilum]|uniref:Luciferase-like monooxygenase n=1 Tax=Mycobacteroides salmoniphilum TaxID=404941 RepID=A0A4V3I0A1_9MYCO|nr:hypothetical protein [Mycobacteroides salmoniphilum]TDZ98610.1 hypothetical protein CCUG60885_00481 [Mycobacteroides salmoniphilum]TEA03140.1 hypothetical protein CCUG60883_03765 [Mycobacteroides salmoniphilum]
MSTVAAVATQHQTFRVFTDDAAGWRELTNGAGVTARVNAPDLKQAQRARHSLRTARKDALAVILDIYVHIEADSRSARKHFASLRVPSAVSYAGTPEGLAGLIADIYLAGVADGVTLIPASPTTDIGCATRRVLALLPQRIPLAA